LARGVLLATPIIPDLAQSLAELFEVAEKRDVFRYLLEVAVATQPQPWQQSRDHDRFGKKANAFFPSF